jgi:hypothetical protein
MDTVNLPATIICTQCMPGVKTLGDQAIHFYNWKGGGTYYCESCTATFKTWDAATDARAPTEEQIFTTAFTALFSLAEKFQRTLAVVDLQGYRHLASISPVGTLSGLKAYLSQRGVDVTDVQVYYGQRRLDADIPICQQVDNYVTLKLVKPTVENYDVD